MARNGFQGRGVKLIVLMIVGALVGCRPRQSDVGSTHLAVLSATSWDEYQHELQPAFKIDEKEALSMAVPVTSRLDQAVLDAVIARLTMSAGDRGILGPPTTQAAATPQPTSRPSDTVTAYSGAADSLVAVDPFLKYQLATALMQEVKLVNRYVSDAALSDRFDPYIVRLQLTSVQQRRDLAVDYYHSIGFFASESTAANATQAVAQEERGEISPFAALEAIRAAKGEGVKPEVAMRLEEKARGYQVPRVIPMLVADQVEAAIRSQRVESLRQLALAVTLAFGQVQGSTGIDAVHRKIEEALGRDYNSLLTIGRQTENVLRVRIGARRVLNKEYESLTQNHYVTAVVLVPKGCRKLEIVSRGDIVDAVDGKKYYPESRVGRAFDEFVVMADELGEDYPVPGFWFLRDSIHDPIRAQMAELASRGDFYGFLRELRKIRTLELDEELTSMAEGQYPPPTAAPSLVAPMSTLPSRDVPAVAHPMSNTSPRANGPADPSRAASTMPSTRVVDRALAYSLFVALGSTRLGDRYNRAIVELRNPYDEKAIERLKGPTTRSESSERSLARDDGTSTTVTLTASPLLANRLLSARLTLEKGGTPPISVVTNLVAESIEVRPREARLICKFPTLKALGAGSGPLDRGTMWVSLYNRRTNQLEDLITVKVTYVRVDERKDQPVAKLIAASTVNVGVPAGGGVGLQPPDPTVDMVVSFDPPSTGKAFVLVPEGIVNGRVHVVDNGGNLAANVDWSSTHLGFVVTAGAPVDGKVPSQRLRLTLSRAELRPHTVFQIKLIAEDRDLISPPPVSVTVLP